MLRIKSNVVVAKLQDKNLIEVDLQSREVRYNGKKVGFELDDYTRWRLMEGLDDIGLTLRKIDEVEKFEKNRAVYKPKTLPILS